MVFQRVIVRTGYLLNRTLLQSHNSTNTSILRLISTTNRCCYADRWYTDKHEWIEIVGKTGIIGISHYAQEALGDVVYAQLPDVDTKVKQKEECGALESVKAASELFSPISGRVIEKNTKVEDTPSLINSSCYKDGWLFKVELMNENEIKNLMSEQQYKEFLKTSEAH